MSTEPCIEPNADIAGKGVRFAIYIQAILCAIMLLVALRDRKVSGGENKDLQKTISSVLLTGCALLISTISQAAKVGLSAYHTIIVLNLCWINCWTLFISWWGFTLAKSHSNRGPAPEAQQAALTVQSLNTEPSQLVISPSHTPNPTPEAGSQQSAAPSKLASSLSDQVPEAEAPQPDTSGEPYVVQFIAVSSVNLSLMSALGLWVWAKIETFGNTTPECNKLSIFVIFGKDVPITNPGLRYSFIFFYALIAIPLANLLLLALLRHQVTRILGKLVKKLLKTKKKTDGYRAYLIRIIIPLFFYVTFVVNNELMINRNTGLMLSREETDWTLGQTLPLVLLIIPVIHIWERRRGQG
jgi:hypothetical protein